VYDQIKARIEKQIGLVLTHDQVMHALLRKVQ